MIIIFKKEDGAVLVLSIIIIAVLMILITALAGSINSNISFTKRHENDVKAFYAAEAGIEKGINSFKKNKENFKDLIEDNKDNQDEERFSPIDTDDLNVGEYNLLAKDIGTGFYKLKSIGTVNNLSRTITITINKSLGNGSVITGGEIIQFDHGNKTLSIEDAQENVGADNIPDIDWESIKNNIDYENKSVGENIYDDLKNINSDTKIYSAGDLKINADKKNSSLGDSKLEDQIIVVSEGNVEINNFKTLYNLVVIAKGQINVDISAANWEHQNVFFYSELESDNTPGLLFNRDKGEGSGNPNFEFYGQMFAKGSADFHMKVGSEDKSGIYYQSIELPDEFSSIKQYIKSTGFVNISSWEER